MLSRLPFLSAFKQSGAWLSTKADIETLKAGAATVVRLAERQWNPSATVPPAAMAAVAAAGNEGAEGVGVMRDVFAMHSEPERKLSEIARLTEDGSVEVASSAAHARTRVVVDHYAPDGSGSFTLGASSIDFCEYLAHSDVALHLVPSVAGDARKGRPPPRTGEQSTNEVLMVAPTAFGFNEQTAQDNHFMHVAPQAGDGAEGDSLTHRVLREYAGLYRKLADNHGVDVTLCQHSLAHNTPDAVFPNNWFSTHSGSEADGNTGEDTLVLYPMKCPNRAAERRPELVELVQGVATSSGREYSVYDMSSKEDDGVHFEGTGVLVLDRPRGTAYVSLSERADAGAAQEWVENLGYKQLVTFKSFGANAHPVYHTNVMMAVGTGVAIVCGASVKDEKERQHLMASLSKTHEVVDISMEQMGAFCGNALEVLNHRGLPVMAMSTQAYRAFTEDQRKTILRHCAAIAHAPIDTIESVGGGGVRCAIAELF